MRALVFHGPGNMELTQVATHPLLPGEIRIHISLAGICGTDLRIFRGIKRVDGPRIIGHEFFGTISEIGPGVTGYDLGERVVVYPIIACGHCYACQAGRENICVNRRTLGYEIDGGFAEYVTVPAAAVQGGNVVPVPSGVSDIAAAASEPAAAALQGVRRAGELSGRNVLVMGGGPLGVAHIQHSQLFGANQVILSEPDEGRRDQGLRFGADVAIHPSELADTVTGQVDVVFIDAGIPSLVSDAIAVLRKGGKCVVFAGMPENSPVLVDPNRIHYGEIDLVGSSGSTPQLQAEVLRYVDEGRLDLEAVVSDVLPMDEWKRGFDMKADAAGLKVLISTGD
ncbi:MAG: threonine dehydrogenase [Naasia sp.]|jgi:L-iditol 2-dehydrogenase|uniref:alcohol dehydrogenase catalytic domain-containing protein n=1 Tax=Naasia sp. TaxID=2546198 RepID=UPI00260BB593|nr:alcohol dehydrogenase catalytic domain-containing protein [Naasia sp.]MCU1570817.1 threonine dehydrogenase [Naasia sp.]